MMLTLVLCALLGNGLQLADSPVSRKEIITRALAFTTHPWTCSQKNLKASCASSYVSDFHPGEWVGLPYDWGGSDGLSEFDLSLKKGAAAGSHSETGGSACACGVDCSGFVSRCWKVAHHSTAAMPQITTKISLEQALEGDAFNNPGVHIILFGGLMEDGWPLFFESSKALAHINHLEGWMAVDGFVPIRFKKVSDAPLSDEGTLNNPIKVNQFPFVDYGDTRKSLSDLIDFCGAAPEKRERGPELFYELELERPGQLTVTVQDDAGVDIDLHVFTRPESFSCLARDDKALSLHLSCGSYLVSADTWTDSGGHEYPGPYVIQIDFSADGAPCVAGQQPQAEGAPGTPCVKAGAETLWCNPSTGADGCLEGGPGQTPFCSVNCAEDAACEALFPGGCCEYLHPDTAPAGSWCLPPSLCPAPRPDPAPDARDSAPEARTWDNKEAVQDSASGTVEELPEDRFADCAQIPDGPGGGAGEARKSVAGGGASCQAGGAGSSLRYEPVLLLLLLFWGLIRRLCRRSRIPAARPGSSR